MATVAGEPKSDVSAAYAAWDAAFNKGDAKAIAGMYGPNAKVIPSSHDIVSGPSEIEKLFSGFITSGANGHKLELIDAGGDGKTVWGTSTWALNGKDKDGKAVAMKGTATHVFERQADDSLKVRVHTWN